MSISTTAIVSWLNHFLEPEPVVDVSINGLQVPGGECVSRVAVATDASLEVFEATVFEKCDFLFVHHGLFWNFNRESLISPLLKKKLKILFDHEISLYASHLPLDMHPECGNNVTLANLLNLQNKRQIARSHGLPMGIAGELPENTSFEDLCNSCTKIFQDTPKVYQFTNPKNIAVVSGQGQNALLDAQKDRFDTLITGEMNHYMYHVAKENKINVILCGHYKTETLGPIEIGKKLNETFQVPFVFLDFPTGL